MSGRAAAPLTPKELTALKLRFYVAIVRDPDLWALDLRIAWVPPSKYLNSESLVAWPSAETLAGELGASISDVRRSIKRLTAPGGWFTIEKGGGRRRANFEKVAARPPDPPLKEPFKEPVEEPFEGARGARLDAFDDVAGRVIDNFARQGDRGSGNTRAQGHLLLPLEGGNQQPDNRPHKPDWIGWVAWLQGDQGMTKERAWKWLMTTIERIETARGVDSTEAGAIADRALKRRRKAAA